MNPMWQEQNQQLYRKFEFPDFKSAFEFMTLVAQKAETLQHHPTWTNTYNSVEIWLTTMMPTILSRQKIGSWQRRLMGFLMVLKKSFKSG